MKDNRDKQMAQLADWTWDLNGYAGKVPFYNADDLTMREVQSVFQLDPEPPQMELNDYIWEAIHRKDLAGKQNDAVDNIFGSCYNLTEMINAVINPRSVRSGFYRRTE